MNEGITYPALLFSEKYEWYSTFRGEIEASYEEIQCMRLVNNEDEAVNAAILAERKKHLEDRSDFKHSIIPISEIDPDVDVFDCGHYFNLPKDRVEEIEQHRIDERERIIREEEEREKAEKIERTRKAEEAERLCYERLKEKFEKENTMQTAETVVNNKGITCYKGKWGWYPCDYDNFMKLKELNKHWQKAIRSAASWNRWSRKEEQNRVSRRKIRNDSGQVIGYGEPVPIPEPKINETFHKFAERYSWEGGEMYAKPCIRDLSVDYSNARYPKENPDFVIPLNISTLGIDKLMSEIE